MLVDSTCIISKNNIFLLQSTKVLPVSDDNNNDGEENFYLIYLTLLTPKICLVILPSSFCTFLCMLVKRIWGYIKTISPVIVIFNLITYLL